MFEVKILSVSLKHLLISIYTFVDTSKIKIKEF